MSCPHPYPVLTVKEVFIISYTAKTEELYRYYNGPLHAVTASSPGEGYAFDSYKDAVDALPRVKGLLGEENTYLFRIEKFFV